jgi:hypothetical protein
VDYTSCRFNYRRYVGSNNLPSKLQPSVPFDNTLAFCVASLLRAKWKARP